MSKYPDSSFKNMGCRHHYCLTRPVVMYYEEGEDVDECVCFINVEKFSKEKVAELSDNVYVVRAFLREALDLLGDLERYSNLIPSLDLRKRLVHFNSTIRRCSYEDEAS